jgi:N-acetylmuramoyl-L-alanine amidase
MRTGVFQRIGGALAAGLLLAVASFPALAAPAVEVRGVRVWASPDSTRVVFDLSGQPRHALSRARNPERVVVDVPNGRYDASAVVLPDPQGAMKGVRIAPRGSGLRIVFDVDATTRSQAFVADPNSRYGWRLVVDLKGPAGAGVVSGRTPAAATGATPAIAATLPSGDRADERTGTLRGGERSADAGGRNGPERGGAAAADTEAATARAAVRAALPPARDLVIAVDAGHGGVDPGAIGRRGTREKDVTLAIARTLAARLNDEPGMRAVLTRNGDYFVPLRQRINRARAANADLFVSVHADAVADRSVAGSSVYILSPRGASSEAARRLAERENAADLVGGVKISNKDPLIASVLLDLSQSAAMAASQVAAEEVLDRLNEVGDVRKARVQQAGFVVLKSPDIPSMLIETAFITNPGDEQRLRDPRHQRRIAEAILSGVRAYFRENPPPGTRVAQLTTTDGGGSTRTLNR